MEWLTEKSSTAFHLETSGVLTVVHSNIARVVVERTKKLNRGYVHTVQKMKFSMKDFFSKCDQIRSFLWIWSHLLKKSLMENFIFCAV